MPRLGLLILTILFCFNTLALGPSIGKVSLSKGETFAQRNGAKIRLSKGSNIEKHDLLHTSEKSLLRVVFSDRTSVLIGPNSQFKIKNYSIKKRVNVFKLITGKFRAKIEQRVEEGQRVDFKTKLAGLGVRGTEFLTNSYIVQGKSVTDTALLKGNLATTIKGANSFQLKAGHAFNTNSLKLGKGISKLSPNVIQKLLASTDSLLPHMQNLDGTFNNINDLISKSLSTLSVPSASPIAVGAVIGTSVMAAKKTIPKAIKKKKNKLDLTKEPWDIRDAILRKKQLRAKNECFYWFYKSIPGGGEAERFRRERDCDEYDNDL